MPEFTAAHTLKQNLYTYAAETLWAGQDVQVCFGHPGRVEFNDIVAFMDVTSEQEPVTFGTQRSREEILTVQVMFSIARQGGESDEEAADRGYELLGELEEYVRVTDTTVGGAVRFCFLTSHTSQGATSEEMLAWGRVIEINAVFTAQARVRSA